MYIPNHFKNENLEEVKDFIKANSFGILLTTHSDKIMGSHIPLELEEDMNGNQVIYGHVSKANPQWANFKHEEEVLLIYNGPHAYVSSSWYNHENVPTWNYIAVHIYGQLKVIEEEELLYALDKLMAKYESTMDNPLRMQDLSESTMRQVNGIVGFKVTISEVQAAFKLSQNRDEEDYHQIVHELGKSSCPMDKNLSEVMNKNE